MNNITSELERVVHENLNDVQIGVFKREMDRLQAIESEFVQLREEHKELKQFHLELTKEFDNKKLEISEILDREKNLIEREAAMAKQKTQLHIDNKLIELRKENAEQRVEDHKKMVELVFRGPVFQKTVIESKTSDQVVALPVSDSGMIGSTHREYGLNESKTTTTTNNQE